MTIRLSFVLVFVALATACAAGDPINSRQGFPLPVPWETGRLPGTGKIGALDLSADGKTLYALTWENGAEGWNLVTKESVPVPPDEEAKLTPLRNHSNDGTPRPRPTVWEPIYENEPMTYEPHVVSADGNTSYQAMDGGAVQILDLTKRPPPRRWNIGDYNRAFAIDTDTGNLATGGHLIAWNVKTGAILGDQPQYNLDKVSHPDCVFWQNHVPYGLVVLRAPASPATASALYGGPPEGIDQLGKLDLKSGDIVEKSPLPQNVYISRSGLYLLAGSRTPEMVVDNSAGKTPGFGNYKVRPSLQLYDADLKPIGAGFVMDRDTGTSAATISPNDKLIAALGVDGDSGMEKDSVRIFDLATQKSLLSDPLVVNGVILAAVDDQNDLFVATKYGDITEYHVPSGEKTAEVLKAHRRTFQGMAVSPDNKVLATLAGDDLIKLWSIPDLKPLGFLESPSSEQETWRNGLGFYDANTVINITNQATHEIQLLPIGEAVDEATWNIDSSTSAGTCLALSSDAKELAIGEGGGVLTVIDNASGKRIARVPAHPGGIKAVEFVADSSKINSYGADGKCLTWDFSTSTNPVAESDAKPTFATISVETGSGPKKIVQADGSINVSPAPGIYRQSELSPHYQYGFSLACPLPSSKVLALATWSHLYLYDLQTERVIWGYSAPSRPTGMVYDPLHRGLITSHEDGVTRRWAIPETVMASFPDKSKK